MAPIPLTLDTDTQDLIDGIRRREKDLAEYQVPRLHDCTGPLASQQRFAGELREDLDVFGRQVETLEIHAEDMARKADRLAVKQLAEEFRESSSKIRKSMRAALLHSKKVIDAQAKTYREELFRDSIPDSRSVQEKATDDVLMKTSNDVTEALRRTIGLMQGELERSVLSHQMLEQSTATIQATSLQHDMLSAATHTSRQLVTALEKADWLDRLLVLAALAFFALVVLFILKQRILDRGLRVAFWWTRFLPVPTSSNIAKSRVVAKDAVHLAMQEKGQSTGSSLVQSIVETATGSLTTVMTSVITTESDLGIPSSSAEESFFTLSNAVFESSAASTMSSPTLDVLTISVLQHAEL